MPRLILTDAALDTITWKALAVLAALGKLDRSSAEDAGEERNDEEVLSVHFAWKDAGILFFVDCNED